jgi:hypothetical protein
MGKVVRGMKTHRHCGCTDKTSPQHLAHSGAWPSQGGAAEAPHLNTSQFKDGSVQPPPAPAGTTYVSPPSVGGVSATVFPYRGSGVTVEHGVKPIDQAETLDDEFTKRMQMATVPNTQTAPPHMVDPVPVVIIDPNTSGHDFGTFQAFTFAVGASPVMIVGKDKRRKRIVLWNTHATDDARFASASSLSAVSGGIIPSNWKQPIELFGQDEIWAVSATANMVTISIMTEFGVAE